MKRTEDTHPLGKVDSALVGDELEDSDMRVELGNGGVGDLERDGELDVELS